MKLALLFSVMFYVLMAFTVADEQEVTGTDRCLLPYQDGAEGRACLAAFKVWWHNHAKGECEETIYGGCGGNANRFPTKEACDEACASLHAQHHHH